MQRSVHGFPYDVVLRSLHDRVRAMAAVRRSRPDLDMKAAKNLIDALPSVIVVGVSREEADRIAWDLRSADAEAEVQGPDFDPDPLSWLLVATTVDEQERGSFAQPGGLEAAWRSFKAEVQVGDELWTFSSPAIMWQCMVGRAGLALLRDGKIVRMLTMSMN